ncbi:two component transcriptional regulator, LuxR family [Maribacter sedimenticola]|uniref:Two component transcriptional regulator, LuxR family n=1 Tax=Maribacter sedimenticola TaxID=228956 RepID=A0ABY1SIN5_9FLAO|nr:response regulator transcription factor [Maribacter sedimenticola]SNR58733.1 two component transcriptional regulator, LuxR family [Maribacter sedimenticola]
MEKIKVLIADDHQILLDGLKAILTKDRSLNVIGTACNGLEVLEFLKTETVDVLLLDLQMPIMDGLETTMHVKKSFPNVKIIMLTTNDEGSIITSLFKVGAIGYLLKNTSKKYLIQGIKDAHEGKKVISSHLTEKMIESLVENPKVKEGTIPKITKREIEVIKLIAQEYTTQEIADALFVSTNTVATHKRNLFVKMEVKNSVGMVRKAVDWGLI